MKRTLLISLLALSCGRKSGHGAEDSSRIRELSRTHALSDEDLPVGVHRVIDERLGVLCYVAEGCGGISCFRINDAKIEEE